MNRALQREAQVDETPKACGRGGVLPHLKEGARASFRRAALVQAGGAGVEPVGCAAVAGAGATGTIWGPKSCWGGGPGSLVPWYPPSLMTRGSLLIASPF